MFRCQSRYIVSGRAPNGVKELVVLGIIMAVHNAADGILWAKSLVDTAALKKAIADDIVRCYMTDFPDEEVINSLCVVLEAY